MKKTQSFIYAFVTVAFLLACNASSDNPGSGTKETDGIANEVQDVNEVIREILHTGSDTLVPSVLESLLSHADIKAFYESRKWQPVWTSAKGLDSLYAVLLNEVVNAESYGLSPQHFHASQIRSLAERSNQWNRQERLQMEFLLSDAFNMFTSALKYGMLDPETNKIVYKAGSKQESPALLDSFLLSPEPTEFLRSNQNTFPRYVSLHNSYLTYKDKYGSDATRTHIPDVKTDSIACYRNAFLALSRLGYLKHAEAGELEGLAALKEFQKDHGLEADGRIGKNTNAWLSKSPADHLMILAANMEKSKWENFADKEYIFLNIPAFRLSIFRNDSLMKEHKVIVGTSATPTPELSSKILFMITFPYWFVPHSISTKEIAPSVRKDPEYLSKKNYMVFDRDRKPVDPSTISWETAGPGSFPYFIRQEGGVNNSLGLIKFIFPNIHSVYLHDTPTKALFSKDIRAFSHGCMRIHRPVDFAAYLLEREQNPIQVDSLDTLIKLSIRRQINLIQPIAIHIRYFTADRDNSGKLFFYTDIYKKDEELIRKLFPAQESKDLAEKASR